MLQMEKFLFSSVLSWCLTFSPFFAPAFGNSRCTSYVVEPPFATEGHPTTVFCKISIRRRIYCIEFSFA